MRLALPLVLALIVIVVTIYAAKAAARPEQGASHPEDDPADTVGERFYRGVDRPAGPDAEDPPTGPT